MKEYALILISTVPGKQLRAGEVPGVVSVYGGLAQAGDRHGGWGWLTTFVLTLSSICSYLANEYLLAPLGLEFMRTIAFILVIAVVVQFHRDGDAQDQPDALSGAGHLSATDHHQLRCVGASRCSTSRSNTASSSRHSTALALLPASPWCWCCLLASGERVAVSDVPGTLPGQRHRPDHCRPDVDGVHGLLRPGGELRMTRC